MHGVGRVNVTDSALVSTGCFEVIWMQVFSLDNKKYTFDSTKD